MSLTKESKYELGIVTGVDIGMRDCNAPVLWFSVDILHGASLQVFSMEEAARLIKEAEVYRLKDLEGRACVVESDNGMVKFVRWHK